MIKINFFPFFIFIKKIYKVFKIDKCHVRTTSTSGYSQHLPHRHKWENQQKKVDPWTILKNNKNLQGCFSKVFFAGTKTQTRHICNDEKHILAQ